MDYSKEIERLDRKAAASREFMPVDRSKRYRLKNPQKTKAHDAVNSAVKRGKLVRPTDCSECANPTGRIEAHHDDYSQLLMVRWVCVKCHKLIHRLCKNTLA